MPNLWISSPPGDHVDELDSLNSSGAGRFRPDETMRVVDGVRKFIISADRARFSTKSMPGIFAMKFGACNFGSSIGISNQTICAWESAKFSGKQS